MTTKEKAQELIHYFAKNIFNTTNTIQDNYLYEKATQCAIKCVEEIIKAEPTEPSNTDWDECEATAQYYYPQKKVDGGKFCGDVLTELKNN